MKQQQIAREQRSHANGIERYNKTAIAAAANGMASTTTPAVKLMKRLLEPATEAIQRWIDSTSRVNASKHKAEVVKAIGAPHAAYLTLSHIINNLEERLTGVAMRLGADLEDNVNLALGLKTPECGALLAFLLKTKYKGASKHNTVIGVDKTRRTKLALPSRADVRRSAKKGGPADDLILKDSEDHLVNVGLTPNERGSIGQSLIQAVVDSSSHCVFHGNGASEEIRGEAPGLFEIAMVCESGRGKRETIQRIFPTKHFLRLMETDHKALEELSPMFEPMLVEPLPWTTYNDGGYLIARLPLLKGVRKAQMAKYDAAGLLEPIKRAINTLQSVRWEYNEFVVNAASSLWESGAQLKCWPEQGERALPAKPAGCEGDEDNFKAEHPELWQNWKNDAGAAHRFNHSVSRIADITRIGRRIDYALSHIVTLLNVAFHEVFQADFRGRLYPVAALITSQGDDMQKAFMQFKDGMEIDEEGAYWIKIQLANTWANNKIDKAPLQDRIDWVTENEEAILSSGTDPLADLWWSGAEGGKKPWLFLATCHEYALWKAHGPGFVSKLPIFVDGSCNGLQHYSALLRSSEDGRLVNLVNVAKPADIYSVVADLANEMLLTHSNPKVPEEAALARKFAGRITRGVSKKPCMTFAYSISYSGIKEQLKSKDLLDFYVVLDNTDKNVERSERRLAVSMLATVILKAIQATVKSAANGMKFLQGITEAAGKNGKAITVTTPDGYKFEQSYMKCAMKQVKTVVSGAISIKKDKASLVQQELASLSGLNLDYRTPEMQTLVNDKVITCKDARELVRQVKTFIDASGVLKFYRSEIEALLVAYTAGFDFAEFLGTRYAQLGLKPVQHLEFYVQECVEMVVRNVMSARHLHEEVTEVTDEETGEITQTRCSISIAEPTDELDVAACVRGCGPNFIHAYDSCHMRMTIASAAAEGLTGFAMVHDSYGTHAADMSTLSRILRTEFVKLHTVLGLETFREENREAAGSDVCDVLSTEFLKYGDLDLNAVVDSAFFFI